jgi:hypothetical protein
MTGSGEAIQKRLGRDGIASSLALLAMTGVIFGFNFQTADA